MGEKRNFQIKLNVSMDKDKILDEFSVGEQRKKSDFARLLLEWALERYKEAGSLEHLGVVHPSSYEPAETKSKKNLGRFIVTPTSLSALPVTVSARGLLRAGASEWTLMPGAQARPGARFS